MVDHTDSGAGNDADGQAPEQISGQDRPSPSRARVSRKTRLIITLSALAVVLAAGVGTAFAVNAAQNNSGPSTATDAPNTADATKSPESTEAAPTTEPEKDAPVRVIAMGDMLPHDSVNANAQVDESKIKNEDFTPNPLKAIVPLVPITILVVGNMWVPAIKMGVAQAMLIGAICALVVSLSNPQEFSKKFFDGIVR